MLPRPCRPSVFHAAGGEILHNGEYREASTRDVPRHGISRGEFMR